MPFISEEIYLNLAKSESVHLSRWPILNESLVDQQLESDMASGIELTSQIHAFRKAGKVKVRIPLKSINYQCLAKLTNDIAKVVKDETNVYDLIYRGKDENFKVWGDLSENNQDITAGQARELVRQVQALRKQAGCKLDQKIKIVAPIWPKEFEKYILIQTLAEKIVVGKTLKIIV